MISIIYYFSHLLLMIFIYFYYFIKGKIHTAAISKLNSKDTMNNNKYHDLELALVYKRENYPFIFSAIMTIIYFIIFIPNGHLTELINISTSDSYQIMHVVARTTIIVGSLHTIINILFLFMPDSGYVFKLLNNINYVKPFETIKDKLINNYIKKNFETVDNKNSISKSI